MARLCWGPSQLLIAAGGGYSARAVHVGAVDSSIERIVRYEKQDCQDLAKSKVKLGLSPDDFDKLYHVMIQFTSVLSAIALRISCGFWP